MGTPNAKAAERKRVLQERKRERQAQLQLQLDEWFERFDEDQNKQLDRNELRKLLMHLHPDTPVEEEALDYLIKRATEIVSASRASVRCTNPPPAAQVSPCTSRRLRARSLRC